VSLKSSAIIYSRPTIPVAGDKLSLQSCLEPHCGRKARVSNLCFVSVTQSTINVAISNILFQFTKIQTVTTKANSIKQTKQGILPVEVSDSDVTEDLLWCTEMERCIFFLSIFTYSMII
jgi:hypothetical protein